MPTIRPADLTDVLVRALGSQLPQVQSPGAAFNVIITAVGGLTTAGIALGTAVANNVTWIAVGNGGGQALVGDTTLANEIARIAILPTNAGNGSGLTKFLQGSFGVLVAPGYWTEIGAFGGTASATPGSGTLYSHCYFNTALTKTANKLVVAQWSAQ